MSATGAAPGDRFVVEADDSDSGLVHLRRVRQSYAGALPGLYGDLGAYLHEEREAWDHDRRPEP